jgi:hypothetical protein
MTITKGFAKEIGTVGLLGAAALFSSGRKQSSLVLGLLSAGIYLWPSSYSLRGKTAVITGGSRGLGLAIAREYLRQGAGVALLARDEA